MQRALEIAGYLIATVFLGHALYVYLFLDQPYPVIEMMIGTTVMMIASLSERHRARAKLKRARSHLEASKEAYMRAAEPRPGKGTVNQAASPSEMPEKTKTD